MNQAGQSVESIFDRASQISTPHERKAYLDEACAGNSDLRARVDALLRASSDAGSFLEKPPEGLVATIAVGENDTVKDGEVIHSLEFLKPSDKPNCLGVIGQYEAIDVVGRGGMGLVLRAYDTKLNRVVAVKVMAPELAASPMAVKRFLREARAAAAVSHDHVVTIYAIEEQHRPPFLAMEFIQGKSLQQKVDRTGALSLEEVLRIGMQMAQGLAAAHAQGLVHRDIKPANILLENGVERVKLTDFGLARAVDDVSVTRTGQIAGTPQFMSPEQAQGLALDARSDLFSLGSVLYTMCTGRPPFQGKSAVAMLRHVTDDQPRAIRETNADIPEWLERIIETLMAKHPDHRFQSANEVAKLLEQSLAHVQGPQGKQISPPLPHFDLPPTSLAAAASNKPPKSAKPPFIPNDSTLGQDGTHWRITAAVVAVCFVAFFVMIGATTLIKTQQSPVQTDSAMEAPRAITPTPPPKEVKQPVAMPTRVAIRTADGTYWQTKSTSPDTVNANSRNVDRIVTTGGLTFAWTEAFTLHWHDEDRTKAFIEAPHGQFLYAFKNPHELRTSTTSGTPKPFTLEWVDRSQLTFRLRTPDGDYVGHDTRENRLLWQRQAQLVEPFELVSLDDRSDHAKSAMRRVGKFDGHRGHVNDVLILGDSQTVVSGGVDSRVRMWDIATRKESRILDWHQGAVMALALSPNGKILASGDQMNNVHLYDTESGVRLGTLEGHTDPLTALAFLPDQRLVSSSRDKTLRIWDVLERKLIKTIDVNAAANEMVALDDKQILFSGADLAGWGVEFYDLNEGKRLNPQASALSCFAVTRDGKTTMIGDISGNIQLLDTKSRKETAKWRDIEGEAIMRAEFSPSGEYLLTTTRSYKMRLWHVAGQRVIADAIDASFGRLAISPDGRFATTHGRGDGVGIYRLPECVWQTKE